MTLDSKKKHPLHMVMVHFPSALYPFSFVMELVGYGLDDVSYTVPAFYALLGGFCGALLALLSGAVELTNIASASKAWSVALWHGGLNLLWIIGFGTLLLIKYQEYPDMRVGEIWYLLTFGILLLGVFISNYLGGELVVNYGIGTRGADRLN